MRIDDIDQHVLPQQIAAEIPFVVRFGSGDHRQFDSATFAQSIVVGHLESSEYIYPDSTMKTSGSRWQTTTNRLVVCVNSDALSWTIM